MGEGGHLTSGALEADLLSPLQGPGVSEEKDYSRYSIQSPSGVSHQCRQSCSGICSSSFHTPAFSVSLQFFSTDIQHVISFWEVTWQRCPSLAFGNRQTYLLLDAVCVMLAKFLSLFGVQLFTLFMLLIQLD